MRVQVCTRLVAVVTSLLEDLKLEEIDDDVEITKEEMNIEVHVSSWFRIKLLFNHVEILPWLTKLFICSYKKVCKNI